VAALAVKEEATSTAGTPAAVGCAGSACVARGSACSRCLSQREFAPALTDGQASFILRTKLAAVCATGEAFEVAWTLATAEIVAHSPPGQARSWRIALEAVRPEFAEAYRRRRIRLDQSAARLA
jgi:hypothetical protein